MVRPVLQSATAKVGKLRPLTARKAGTTTAISPSIGRVQTRQLGAIRLPSPIRSIQSFLLTKTKKGRATERQQRAKGEKKKKWGMQQRTPPAGSLPPVNQPGPLTVKEENARASLKRETEQINERQPATGPDDLRRQPAA